MDNVNATFSEFLYELANTETLELYTFFLGCGILALIFSAVFKRIWSKGFTRRQQILFGVLCLLCFTDVQREALVGLLYFFVWKMI
jgi:hypothetical protein